MAGGRGRYRERGEELAERLLDFVGAVLDMLPHLESFWVSRHIARQLARAASGGGSNDEEACGAESQADFAHKVSIAAKEIREARYWLKLLNRTMCLRDQTPLVPLIEEATQLIAILAASARTARARRS